jgi:hypothetical protein
VIGVEGDGESEGNGDSVLIKIGIIKGGFVEEWIREGKGGDWLLGLCVVG